MELRRYQPYLGCQMNDELSCLSYQNSRASRMRNMCGLVLGDVDSRWSMLKSAGSGYRIEPPVHRTSNAENFSALE